MTNPNNLLKKIDSAKSYDELLDGTKKWKTKFRENMMVENTKNQIAQHDMSNRNPEYRQVLQFGIKRFEIIDVKMMCDQKNKSSEKTKKLLNKGIFSCQLLDGNKKHYFNTKQDCIDFMNEKFNRKKLELEYVDFVNFKWIIVSEKW